MELEIDSDNENVDHSKIELTKAEAEAIDRGLQVLIYALHFIPITAAILCGFVLSIMFG